MLFRSERGLHSVWTGQHSSTNSCVMTSVSCGPSGPWCVDGRLTPRAPLIMMRHARSRGPSRRRSILPARACDGLGNSSRVHVTRHIVHTRRKHHWRIIACEEACTRNNRNSPLEALGGSPPQQGLRRAGDRHRSVGHAHREAADCFRALQSLAASEHDACFSAAH